MRTLSLAPAISGTPPKSPSTISAPAMPLEKLDVGAAVVVRVVPVGAARVIGRDGDLDVVALLRLHGPEDVVGDSAGAHMRTVEMEVRRVEVVRQHHVERHRVGV